LNGISLSDILYLHEVFVLLLVKEIVYSEKSLTFRLDCLLVKEIIRDVHQTVTDSEGTIIPVQLCCKNVTSIKLNLSCIHTKYPTSNSTDKAVSERGREGP
jgi:hypothetical protein